MSSKQLALRSKLMALIVASLIPLCICTRPCEAKFMRVEVTKVPITRLLTNLEAKAKSATDNKDRAMLQFQIGRLHSMAYAAKTEDVPVREDSVIDSHPNKIGASKKPQPEPFFGHGHSDYKQFSLTKAPDSTVEAKAQGHLKLAIEHLNRAVQLDPELIQAKLGLAWCLDQSGQDAKAIPLYKQVLEKRFEEEKNRGGLFGTSVVEETADYLLKLLDPAKDAREIADVKRKKEQVQKSYRAVTPIVVALKPGLSQKEMMKSSDVRFDLDGNGPRINHTWPSANAGWLVFDATGNGKIESGLQLFGCSTFWIFWRDGYEALSALDDDRNSLIEGKERSGLAIWQDLDCDGIAETDEVKSLERHGIEALSCQARAGANGFLHNKEGVKFSSGENGETVDWIVE